ncbi:MAG: hypothetical protein D6E12_11945 [Desulfovibrio sp.]|nr:MAG: hypothetical protein D6E12_11945 [Desulfovibrio sp.]
MDTMKIIEKCVALLVGLVVVGLVIYLILLDEPFQNLETAGYVKTLLSLACAIVGASLPGFLNISYRAGGLVLRAGGAVALFIVVFFYSDRALPVLQQPEVTMELNSAAGHISIAMRPYPTSSQHENAILGQRTTATADIVYTSHIPQSRSIFLDKEMLTLHIDDDEYTFQAAFYAKLLPEEEKWIVDTVSRVAIPPESIIRHETCFINNITWNDFLTLLLESQQDKATFYVTSSLDGTEGLTAECLVDMKYWRDQLHIGLSSEQGIPHMIALACRYPYTTGDE